MVKLNLELTKFKTKQENGITKIYDCIRKKFVALTPEELVRQSVLHFLIFEQKIPSSLIKVESKLKLFNTEKRFDILVFRELKPWLLVECKSFRNEIYNKDIEQALRYNLSLKGPFVMLTNGKRTMLFKNQPDDPKPKPLGRFPQF